MDLFASRQTGMGAGPIWWTTVQEYCVMQELDDLQVAAMHHHVRAMDTVYLKKLQKKSS